MDVEYREGTTWGASEDSELGLGEAVKVAVGTIGVASVARLAGGASMVEISADSNGFWTRVANSSA